MTEKRFQWVFIKDNELEFQDNGIVKRFNNDRLEEFLNELHEELGNRKRIIKTITNEYNELEQAKNSLLKENKQLKQQLSSILKLTKKIEEYTHDIKMIGDVE